MCVWGKPKCLLNRGGTVGTQESEVPVGAFVYVPPPARYGRELVPNTLEPCNASTASLVPLTSLPLGPCTSDCLRMPATVCLCPRLLSWHPGHRARPHSSSQPAKTVQRTQFTQRLLLHKATAPGSGEKSCFFLIYSTNTES